MHRANSFVKSDERSSSSSGRTTSRAALHPLERETPAIDFFAGGILGNGAMGVIVCTRSDAVVLRFGHNDVWDIRLAQENREKLGTFQEICERMRQTWSAGGSLQTDPWFGDYCRMARENYAKPYPRPFPCGSVVLGFDRRDAELLGHRIDIADGLCEVKFLVGGAPRTLQVFVDASRDRAWMRMVDEDGEPCAAPFGRAHVIPDPVAGKDLPAPLTEAGPNQLSFRQRLPAAEAFDPRGEESGDRTMRLTLRLSDELREGAWLNSMGRRSAGDALEKAIVPSGGPFVACVEMQHGPAANVPEAASGSSDAVDSRSFDAARSASAEDWATFWSRSSVELDDAFLERIWYHNLYFLHCALRPGVTCPGLYGNWSYKEIGTVWHGDYHFDYNVQQPFWATFSSNHVEKHLPYVDLIERLLPVAQAWARDFYGMRGAVFPVSAFPVDGMTMSPYPVPTWGWQMCLTPWAVQSLWWHYTYTQDAEFLRNRALNPIRQAVLFMVDYLSRPEAHGPQWGDDRYHFFPTVVPELYGLTDRFEKSRDCIVDITLTRFVFRAFAQACAILDLEQQEAGLLREVERILAHLPDHPVAESPRGGTVFANLPGDDPEMVGNTPNTLMTVFPGEEHGLHSPREIRELAANTYRNQRNEGGNELVFLNLQAARLGLLDLEQFKRQIRYCLLPNGTCTDLALQVHGRYTDATEFDFMARMGIWFENVALPAVINECLMQGYNGVIRLFPNWPKDRAAEFRTLRAAGGFLVSARFDGGAVQWVEVQSEAGQTLRLIDPWADETCFNDPHGRDREIVLPTKPGQVIRLTRQV